MNKKIKSTYGEHRESLSPSRKKKFDQGLKDFVLSELMLALMEHDEISVRKLAKIAGVSPMKMKFKNTPAKITRFDLEKKLITTIIR
jgi:hypothetical protein